MKSPVWTKALKACADPKRVTAALERLAVSSAGDRLAKASGEQAAVWSALWGGSQVSSDLLVAHPDWLEGLDLEFIRFPRRKQGLQREVEDWLKPLLVAGEFAAPLARLRELKQKEMLRIATRDLARLSNVVEITREISNVADVCLDAVLQVCLRQHTGRFGTPYHQDVDGQWRQTEFCVLGMGKLGGQELNYSSDVDVLFVYADEGQVFKESPKSGAPVSRPDALEGGGSRLGRRPALQSKLPRSSMSSHQFFNRLAEAFIAEVSRLTGEGSLFRIDLRLRPEGNAGPLTRSLESYENYYAQWGQTWERMMLIKARGVAGSESLAGEFLEMIQNFRYPRSVNENVLGEVAAMKARIESEILREDEVDRNVKLGRGGIREIEFVVQALQLIHAGRQPFLQIPQTLPCLAKLAQYRLLEEGEVPRLDAAYRFLRDVEHRLQMDQNLQTHTLPKDATVVERVARLMGFESAKEFESARRTHSENVRKVYDGLLRVEPADAESEFPRQFDAAEAAWKEILRRHAFRDLDSAFRRLKEFVEGPGFVHVSQRTSDLARQLLPKLFGLCRKEDADTTNSQHPTSNSQGTVAEADQAFLSDPDRVLTRLDTYVQAYGARATLFELWNSQPSAFEMLLMLFDRSEFLAETVIRSPELLDDLVVGERLRTRKDTTEILRDLRHGVGDPDQFEWLRRYHEAERLRVGLRDILGLADFEQNLAELSALADACLQYALEVVMRENKLKSPPFVIIGLGKLGGLEINYGSDLDILFVTAAKAKALPKLQKLAARVMELLSRRTARGLVCETDARLRPDGEKGLLVNTLEAYEQYYRERAQLWEIQALTRTRPVAGDAKLGEKFQKLAAQLTDFSVMGKPLTPALSPSEWARGKRSDAGRNQGRRSSHTPVICFSSDWKKKIHEMRIRIEKERTPVGQDALAIKTGRGGMMDAEFIAQAMCLEHCWCEAHTLRALERGRASGGLSDAEKLIENYQQLRRLEGILRRWSYEGETVLPDDPAPFYRVAVRCGFATAEQFRLALAEWRQAVRDVYDGYFEVN